jgi:hypothetical protein
LQPTPPGLSSMPPGAVEATLGFDAAQGFVGIA